MRESVFFISDAHLGIDLPGCTEREAHLHRFLRSIQRDASALFILGDLFDFWIEYRHVIRSAYVPTLSLLRQCVENGIDVHYLAGNHDFALGSYLNRVIGIRTYLHPVRISLQGKQLSLFHGDGLIPSEWGYRFIKRLFRLPWGQKLYRLLHPDIGIPLALFFSAASRRNMSHQRFILKQKHYLAYAKMQLSRGNDIVLLAHTHHAGLYTFNDKVYCNTGEWMHTYNYAKLHQGVLSLWEYLPDGDSRQVKEENYEL